VVALTARLLDDWSPGERRDVWRALWELTVRVVCRTMLGVEADGEAAGLVSTVWRWLHLSLAPASLVLPLDLPLMPYRRFLSLSRRLDWAIATLIDRRRAESAGGSDMLGALLEAHEQNGDRVSAAELVGQVNFLLFAGTASTANGLAWTLLLLAQHPAVLADLCDELSGCLRGDPPTAEQLGGLPLLDHVIQESLRLLPPIPLSGRVAAEATELGGYALPRQSAAVYSIYHTHRDPERYPQPDRFVPERWAGLASSPYEYLPFGAGPRMCLGETLAMVEMKVVLAMLLQRYRPELAPGTRIDRFVGIVLAPRRGLPMILNPADGRFPRGPAAVRGNVREMVDWG
jgi:cytochrome P450